MEGCDLVCGCSSVARQSPLDHGCDVTSDFARKSGCNCEKSKQLSERIHIYLWSVIWKKIKKIWMHCMPYTMHTADIYCVCKYRMYDMKMQKQAFSHWREKSASPASRRHQCHEAVTGKPEYPRVNEVVEPFASIFRLNAVPLPE